MGMKTINGYEAVHRTRSGPVQIDRYSSRSREAEDSIYWDGPIVLCFAESIFPLDVIISGGF
mgnify:FL=1